ncbi:MAG: type I restriction enzyme HsdR N-terminal domain-containing protein [Chryseolinea sp.]
MIALNLPTFEYILKKESGKMFILDILRKKYLVLTPEEWVRQHFIHFLIKVHHYPRSLIKVEGGLTFNRLQKRSDIVIFNREGQPWMVVECKAPDVKLRQDTIEQAAVYNHTLKARYIVITNGMTHYYCEVNWEEGTTLLLTELPVFG